MDGGHKRNIQHNVLLTNRRKPIAYPLSMVIYRKIRKADGSSDDDNEYRYDLNEDYDE
ncbi:19202_t:CDS:2 [Funneliformis geosporum]|nr:19202_t:CDS:2 [Funneliformis geosporum]